MEFSTNIILIFAVVILALYVLMVAVLFLPIIGFAIVPILILAFFAAFAILASIFYVNYDSTQDYTKDSISHLATITVITIVLFLVAIFVMWFFYTQYTKDLPADKVGDTGLDFDQHLEDIDPKNPVETPFTMENRPLRMNT